MGKEVKLAIIDNDLKARTVENYPVSDDGTKIRVVSGGEGHFMPSFDNHSFIEFPRPRYRGGGWNRIYFVKKGAKKCIDFKTELVTGPDLEQMKKAVAGSLLDKMGKQEPPFPTWVIYLILLFSLGTLLKVFGVIA